MGGRRAVEGRAARRAVAQRVAVEAEWRVRIRVARAAVALKAVMASSLNCKASWYASWKFLRETPV